MKMSLKTPYGTIHICVRDFESDGANEVLQFNTLANFRTRCCFPWKKHLTEYFCLKINITYISHFQLSSCLFL